MKYSTSAALAAIYAAVPVAAVIRNCPSGNSAGCFSWAVPSTSSSSNNVYFQIEAPTSYQWVALGLGSRMVGADMFIVYQDGSGNVTLSTRSASGQFEPSYEQRSGVELIAGSGVMDGKMIANVKCSGDCSRNIDRSSSNNWIAAWRSGGSLQSSSTSAEISEHSDHFNFGIDMSQASISSDANPFVGSSQGNTGSSGGGGSSSDSGSGKGVTSGNSGVSRTVLTAHGVIMAITFAVLYPIGSILMPMLGKWLVHGIAQLVAFLLMWAGFGLGYYYSNNLGTFFTDTHMRIGTITVALLGIQPILGWIHHASYKRYQRRTIISHVHIWYGRALMILGIVNGGMGLRSNNADAKFKIAYAVVAGVFGGLYIGAAVWGAIKRARAPATATKESAGSDRSGMSG